MKVAAVLFVLASSVSSAWALDVSQLPDSCKTFLEVNKADKPSYAQLSGSMTKARKANDMATFCASAKSLLAIVQSEDEKLDVCLGEVAVAKTATPATVGQFTDIKSYYRTILSATKDSKNDHMHCGLAD